MRQPGLAHHITVDEILRSGARPTAPLVSAAAGGVAGRGAKLQTKKKPKKKKEEEVWRRR